MLQSLLSIWSFCTGCCMPMRCANCSKRPPKRLYRMNSEELREWEFSNGMLFCERCCHELEKGEIMYTSSQHGLLRSKGSVTQGSRVLKKVDSGKVWDKSSSFRQPYKQSPAVTEKLSKHRVHKTSVVPQFSV